MASTFLSLHYHIVFSTKDRRPLLREPWRRNLHEYLGGTVRGLGGIPEIVGGIDDHVHLLIGLKATHCLSDFMRDLKRSSSNWIAENHEPTFAWQDGYAAFTVSVSNCEVVREYIQNQPEHHRRISLQSELVRLLKKHGVKYDEKFLLG
jgi:REP element-mobilizing transposase RayT